MATFSISFGVGFYSHLVFGEKNGYGDSSDLVVYPPRSKHELLASPRKNKADVAEHPKVSHHVGLLANEPPGKAELLPI
jgi:hypothetical protein